MEDYEVSVPLRWSSLSHQVVNLRPRVAQVDMDVPIAANVLGTLGAVC